MRQKQFHFFLAAALISFLFFSCKDKTIQTTKFTATMTGANERPNPTPSTATGAATLTFNTESKSFTIVISYTGLTPNAGHIHKGAVDVAGPVIFPFTGLTSPITYVSPALTADQEADLNAGSYYVNLHTTDYPSGEIRGQLIKQ